MSKEEINYALPKGTIIYSKPTNIRYKVVEVLGAGGFGITYKVETTVMVDNVPLIAFFAIKEHFMSGCYRDTDGCTIISTPQMEKTVELSRRDFITEAKRLNKLGSLSQNIVKVNEVFEYFGTAYYVMQFLDGGELSRYIAKQKKLSEVQSLALIKPVASAVSLLHEERLLHLDIKPDNIVLMTRPDTGELYPVLIDFGIAKHFNSSGKPTSTHSAKGASDGYAPMEQYSKIDYFAPEMDVYALGATLLHMLSGQIPKNAFDISEDIIQSMIPETVSQKIRYAILHAMQSRKNDRTQSVKEFLEELEHIDFNPKQVPVSTSESVPTVSLKKNVAIASSKTTGYLSSKKYKLPLKTIVISLIVAFVVLGVIFGSKFIMRSSKQPIIEKISIAQPSDSDSTSILTPSVTKEFENEKDIVNNNEAEENPINKPNSKPSELKPTRQEHEPNQRQQIEQRNQRRQEHESKPEEQNNRQQGRVTNSLNQPITQQNQTQSNSRPSRQQNNNIGSNVSTNDILQQTSHGRNNQGSNVSVNDVLNQTSK